MRTRFDQFGKQMLRAALARRGPVESEAEVPVSGTRRIDLWFMPDAARAAAELEAMRADAPERVLALPILVRLRLEIPRDPAQRTADDEEFLMDTQDIVETGVEKPSRRDAQKASSGH
jgi:hypothetical protein